MLHLRRTNSFRVWQVMVCSLPDQLISLSTIMLGGNGVMQDAPNPNKIKFFFWLLSHLQRPTNYCLYSIGLNVSPLCRCCSGSKSIFHMSSLNESMHSNHGTTFFRNIPILLVSTSLNSTILIGLSLGIIS